MSNTCIQTSWSSRYLRTLWLEEERHRPAPVFSRCTLLLREFPVGITMTLDSAKKLKHDTVVLFRYIGPVHFFDTGAILNSESTVHRHPLLLVVVYNTLKSKWFPRSGLSATVPRLIRVKLLTVEFGVDRHSGTVPPKSKKNGWSIFRVVGVTDHRGSYDGYSQYTLYCCYRHHCTAISRQYNRTHQPRNFSILLSLHSTNPVPIANNRARIRFKFYLKHACSCSLRCHRVDP